MSVKDGKQHFVGEELYLRRFTGRYYCDIVKDPYTVVKVEENEIVVQKARLRFPIFHYDPKTMSEYYKQFDGKETAFFDTIAEGIEHDPYGRLITLSWHPKRAMWGEKGVRDADYPYYAVFGKYEHQPYLD